MSLIPKQTVQIIAQGIGISHLGEDVAAALAPDAEYRMREIIQVSVDTWPHLLSFTLTIPPHSQLSKIVRPQSITYMQQCVVDCCHLLALMPLSRRYVPGSHEVHAPLQTVQSHNG